MTVSFSRIPFPCALNYLQNILTTKICRKLDGCLVYIVHYMKHILKAFMKQFVTNKTKCGSFHVRNVKRIADENEFCKDQ